MEKWTCLTCGERLIALHGQRVHHYNLKLQCPNGKGQLLAGRARDSQETDKDVEVVEAEVEAQPEDLEGSEGAGEGSGEGEAEGVPDPVDAWADAAAVEINLLWMERVQKRGNRPTEEELVKILLAHAKKGA